MTYTYGAIAPYENQREAKTMVVIDSAIRLRAGAATANKEKQRRLYPNGPVFGDELGHDPLWLSGNALSSGFYFPAAVTRPPG